MKDKVTSDLKNEYQIEVLDRLAEFKKLKTMNNKVCIESQKCICVIGHPYNNSACPIHGLRIEFNKPKATDFKIPENLKQIEQNNWDEIMDEFKNSVEFKYCTASQMPLVYMKWLRANYLSPEKK